MRWLLSCFLMGGIALGGVEDFLSDGDGQRRTVLKISLEGNGTIERTQEGITYRGYIPLGGAPLSLRNFMTNRVFLETILSRHKVATCEVGKDLF